MKNIIVSGIDGGERFAIMVKRNSISTNYNYALATVKDSTGSASINYCLSIGEGYYTLSVIRVVNGIVNGIMEETFMEEVKEDFFSAIWETSIEYLLNRWGVAGMVNADLKRLWNAIPESAGEPLNEIGSFLDIVDDGWYSIRVN